MLHLQKKFVRAVVTTLILRVVKLKFQEVSDLTEVTQLVRVRNWGSNPLLASYLLLLPLSCSLSWVQTLPSKLRLTGASVWSGSPVSNVYVKYLGSSPSILLISTWQAAVIAHVVEVLAIFMGNLNWFPGF